MNTNRLIDLHALGEPAVLRQIFAEPREDQDLERDLNNASDDELRQMIADCSQRAGSIADNAKSQARDMSDREARRLEKIERLQAAAAGELESRRPMARRTQVDGLNNAIAAPSSARPDAIEASNRRAGILLPQNRAGIGAALFGNRVDPVWRDTDEFFRTIANGLGDPRLLQNATGTEGVGVDGGFSVPTEFYRGVMDQALQASEFAVRCRVFPSPSNNLTIPMPNVQDRQIGVAGLNAAWTGEAQQATAQVMKWRAVELKLHKLMLLSEASNELLEDGLNFTSQLSMHMSASGALKLDAAVIAGSGVGQPLGFIGHPSVIAIAPESGQAADTVLFQNLVSMYGRMHPACQRRAVWFISPGLVPQLMAMKHPDTNMPVLLSGGQNDAAAGAPAQTIFGRPVVVTELAAQPGDAGDIVFADMSQYALLLKSTAVIEYSPHLKFDYDVAAWRMKLRVGGQPLWNTVITTENDSTFTLSWATYLQARS